MTDLISPFNPNYQIPNRYRKIYVSGRASIPERAAMWRECRSLGWNINSSWIDAGETEDLETLWVIIQLEVSDCDTLILYAEEFDFPLKGALVEVGMALGMGKPVIVVLPFEPEGGTLRPIGSWIKHPRVTIVKTVQEALDMAYGIVENPADKASEAWTIEISAAEIDKIIDEIDPTFKDRIKSSPKDVEEWAARLAADSVACGEAEYGPDYPSNKA